MLCIVVRLALRFFWQCMAHAPNCTECMFLALCIETSEIKNQAISFVGAALPAMCLPGYQTNVATRQFPSEATSCSADSKRTSASH